MTALASTYTYKVTNQIPTQGQGPDGKYVPGMLVSIRTDKSGLMGNFFVPDSQYDKVKVAALAASLAQRLEEVHTLTGA